LALIQKYGMTVHAFDPTPKSIQWVKRQSVPPQFVLHEYGIANCDGEVQFFAPENPAHVSHTVIERKSSSAGGIKLPVRRLTSIMDEIGDSGVDILKMDIEGAEYSVLEDILQSRIVVSQILVEFHHRFEGVTIKDTQSAVKSLNEHRYSIFWVSASGEEVS